MEDWEGMRQDLCGDIPGMACSCDSDPFLTTYEFFIIAFIVMAILAFASSIGVIIYCARKACRCASCCRPTYDVPHRPPVPVKRTPTPHPRPGPYANIPMTPLDSYRPPTPPRGPALREFTSVHYPRTNPNIKPRPISMFKPITPARSSSLVNRSRSFASVAPRIRTFNSMGEAMAAIAHAPPPSSASSG
jgi:hypothetical protein